MSKKLEEIRGKIDALDDKIHDLLMQRAELIIEIAEEKRKKNLQYVQPAREAVMIRRLLSRHKGALPAAAIVRIWRELVGAVSLLQTGLKVSVGAENGSSVLWDMAKDYFGSVVPMQKLASPLAAIASVRENESSFAVLPWPSDENKSPWWVYLFNQEERKKKIVCALPYGQAEGEVRGPADKGLVISKIDFVSSGEDRSFIVLETDANVSRARIVEVFEGLKLKTVGLNSFTGARSGNSLHMAEVDVYIAEDDKRLEQIKDKFEGRCLRCVVLGGYPVPPLWKAAALSQ